MRRKLWNQRKKESSGYEAYLKSLNEEADEMSSKVSKSERMSTEEAIKEDKEEGVSGSRVQVAKAPAAPVSAPVKTAVKPV